MSVVTTSPISALPVNTDKLAEAIGILPSSRRALCETPMVEVIGLKQANDAFVSLKKSNKRGSDVDLAALAPNGGLELKRVRSNDHQPLPGLPASLRDDMALFAAPTKMNVAGKSVVVRRLAAASNCRVESKHSREALQFVAHGSLDFPGLADRVKVPASMANRFEPCPAHLAGAPYRAIALMAVEPGVIKDMNLEDLKTLMDKLSEQRVRLRWWNNEGKLGTQSVLHTSKDMSATTALLLAMRVRDGDVVCHRMLSLANASVLKELARVGASSFIREDNIATVLRDALECIVDKHGPAVGREATVVKAASKAVTEFMKQSHAAENPERMSVVLRDLVATCRDITDEGMMGAFVGVVMSGLFNYIKDVQDRDQKIADGVKSGAGLALSFLEEAPGGKIASQILSIGFNALVDEVAKRAHNKVKDSADIFMANLLISVEKEDKLPGAGENAAPLTPGKKEEFFRWITHTMRANGY